MDKKKATDYSKDAFLHNPPASANDHTGYSTHGDIDASEAQSLADLMDVSARHKDSEVR